MSNQKVVGKHKFGYLREKDPNRRRKKSNVQIATSYKVQKGDSLGKIAQKLIKDKQTNFTDARKLATQLIAVNKLKDNGNKIYIGQVLKLPQGVNENVS